MLINFFKFIIVNFPTIIITVIALLYLIKKFKKIQIFLFILLLLIFYSPLANILVYSIEKINDPRDINKLTLNFDKIVILSGNEDVQKTKEFNQLYLGGTNNRLIEGLRLHNKYKKNIIFSGSSLTKSNLRDIFVVEKFFAEFITDPKSVIIDDKAKNTEDTFLFLKENFKNEKHLIVTSAMHMQRCKLLAIKNEINYILYPVDFKANHENIFNLNFSIKDNLYLFNYGLREIAALLFYKLSNKI